MPNYLVRKPSTTTYLKRLDAKKLINYKHDNPFRRFFFIVSLYTGGRLREIQGLKWKDLLDRDELILHTPKQDKRRVNKITNKITKTPSFRTIKINSEFKKQIDKYYLLSCSNPDRYIFESVGKREPVCAVVLNRWIKKAVKDLGIVTRHASHHMLRKTFGRNAYENLIKKGASPADALFQVQRMFNHSSVQTTIVYIGLQDDKTAEGYDHATYFDD